MKAGKLASEGVPLNEKFPSRLVVSVPISLDGRIAEPGTSEISSIELRCSMMNCQSLFDFQQI